jgi:hypothetical protein
MHLNSVRQNYYCKQICFCFMCHLRKMTVQSKLRLMLFHNGTIRSRSWGSSVSIVSDYGLDDRVIGDRSQAGAKDFSSNVCVQTCSEAHPASCTMNTRGPFPGAKRGRVMTLTTHPHLVPRSRMSRSYTSSPPQAPPWCVAGLLCLQSE